MSNVSSKFLIHAINDGVTVSGALKSSKTLAQAYDPNTGGCSPDWTGTANGPYVYLEAYENGVQILSSRLGDDNETGWYWNGQRLQFNATTGLSTNENVAGVFKKVADTVPKIQIIKNLASSTNTDDDTLEYRGKLTLGSSSLPFRVAKQIRISEIVSGNGYYGYIDGYAEATCETPKEMTLGEYGQAENDDHLYLRGRLYTSGSSVDGTTSGFTPRWYVNGTQAPNTAVINGVLHLSRNGSQNSVQVDDRAVVRLDFLNTSDNTDVLTTEWVTVDDAADDFELYFAAGTTQAAGANPEGYIEVRSGETAHIDVWMAKNKKPDQVLTGWEFNCQLYKKDMTKYTGAIPALNGGTAPSGDGWYALVTDNTTHKASIELSFTLINDTFGGDLTGIVMATSN